ncbi:MAG: hypothetical protein QM753_07525 [Thermomicrobiales bacterium]
MEFWMDLPAWLRLITALIVLSVGVVIFLFISGRLGMILAALGFCMFIFGGKSSSEKSGYKLLAGTAQYGGRSLLDRSHCRSFRHDRLWTIRPFCRKIVPARLEVQSYGS